MKSDKVVLSLARVRNVLMLVVEAFWSRVGQDFGVRSKFNLGFQVCHFLGVQGWIAAFCEGSLYLFALRASLP